MGAAGAAADGRGRRGGGAAHHVVDARAIAVGAQVQEDLRRPGPPARSSIPSMTRSSAPDAAHPDARATGGRGCYTVGRVEGGAVFCSVCHERAWREGGGPRISDVGGAYPNHALHPSGVAPYMLSRTSRLHPALINRSAILRKLPASLRAVAPANVER